MTISKPNIKDFFKEILAEIKGFAYQITLKVLLSKYKEDTDRVFAHVCFGSTAITATRQGVFKWIENWICEGSGWIIELINAEYVNISIYSPLVGRLYIELPDESRTQKKAWLILKIMAIRQI